MFFIGTAADSGSVNVSPKGSDSLRVINNKTIAWLNLTGSGNETAAHILKSPRMTIMFCAFEGAPKILRTYGHATVIHRKDKQWAEYIALFPDAVGARQILVQDINAVQTSFGISVPLYDYKEDREALNEWAAKKSDNELKDYWSKKNQVSIDGFETKILDKS